jgi:hypothetical protein
MQMEAIAEAEALEQAANQPEGPRRRRPAPAMVGKVVAMGVLVAVALIGHRWYSGTATAASKSPVAVADHAPPR